MARKGFVSIDGTNIVDPEDNLYHMVCKPKDSERRPEGLNLPVISTEMDIEEWIRSVTSKVNEQK